MPSYCLVPRLAEKFKQDLIDGKIDPAELAKMTSEERHTFFSDSLGETNAGPVNSLFESKLLLKNQQRGMVTWAKKVTGISEPVRMDMISKIMRMDKVLNPVEEKAFLGDLAAQKLGTNVTYEEASKIADFSKSVTEAKTSINPDSPIGSPERLTYGRALDDLKTYVGDLKAQANKFSLADLKRNPLTTAGKGISELAGNAKAIQASMDNSAIFRQGWKTMLTNPGIWAKNAVRSFGDLIKTFGKDEVMHELNADILSRPNSLNGYYNKAKLDIGVMEEAYPTTLPEKAGQIPYVGKILSPLSKIYKASENAFTAFVRRTRADVFDKQIEIAQRSDVDLTDTELTNIGRLVNSLTGRGNLGRLEPASGVVNNVLFSPKLIKSHIDTLLQPLTGGARMFSEEVGSNFVRKQAAMNLIKVVSGTAMILATAKALKKDSVEFDLRSADFGKIKIGDTRFDVTGGMASIVTLGARLARRSIKSTSTGEIIPLNAKDKTGKPLYGAQTATDVAYDYFKNKLSPAATFIKEMADQSTFEGTRPTLGGETTKLFTPLPLTNYLELQKDPKSANKLLAMIADALGIVTNTYAPPQPKKKK